MSVRRRRGGRRRSRFTYEDVDPMNYVSNLSDVMLILAVGIMLSLILHWEVPVGVTEEESGEPEQSMVTFQEDDLDDQGDMPETAAQVGKVYYDQETGTYYILQNSQEESDE